MDAGVRSSGAMNARRLAKNAFKRAFYVILDGVAMRLTLPAGEWSAVVCNNQL
jgi:hypothetical protein